MNQKTVRPFVVLLGTILGVVLVLLAGIATLAQAQPAVTGQAGTITTNTVGNGTVGKTPDQATYDIGQVVTLTAVADTGWQFVEWSGDLTGSTSPAFLTVTGNHVVTATFEQRCYTLSLSHAGNGSDPAATPGSSGSCPAGQYVAGESISLVASPDTGWQVSGWDGTDNDSSTSTNNNLTMPAANHSASVTYSQICYTLSKTVSPSGSGRIDASPEPNCDGGKYTSGTIVNLTAVPASGFVFNNWSGAISGSDNPTTVTMSSNRAVTANFSVACYALSLTHTGSGADPVASPSGSNGCNPGEYVAGASINLSADPDTGWQVQNWQGTNNDSSTSTSNTLTMPGETHLVAVNYIEKPTLQFSAASYSVTEDGGSAVIEVVRTGSTAEFVTVKYRTSNGTATAGQDYTARNGTLNFPANVTSRTFSVPILDDNVAEGTEFLNLRLTDPSDNALLGPQATAELDILDDEGTPTVQFSSDTYAAGESDGTATVTISLFPASTEHVFVDVSTQDGTATNGEDYQAVNQTLHFLPGQMSKEVTVPLIDDPTDEADETVMLMLTFVQNADVGRDEATLTILDDDDPPTVQFSSSEYFATEGEPTAAITVTLSQASAFAITVEYDATELLNGSLSQSAVFGQLTFNPGEDTAVITLPINDNKKGDEIIFILRSPENATLGTPSSARLFILDPNRSECHDLNLGYTGSGSLPSATNLNRSPGCASGQYVAGELISLSASPATGWSVAGWNGTLNDSSTSNENVVLMPDRDHTATVRYVTFAYVSSLLNNYTDYFTGPGEAEPNNLYTEANGPLQPDFEYNGIFPSSSDTDDWYFFYLNSQQMVDLALTNMAPGHNYDLILRRADLSPVLEAYLGLPDNSDENVSVNLSAGLYYIQVFNRGMTGSTQPYNLRVIYN